MFRCDPEKYKCGSICCKNLMYSPIISIKDLKNIADSLELNITDAWKEHGSIINVNENGTNHLRMGPRYSPFCSLLEDSRCKVHDKKPLQCDIYPVLESFCRDDYSCLKKGVSYAQLLEKERKHRIHHREAIRDSTYLFEGIVLEDKLSSEDVAKTIVDSLDLYASIKSRKHDPRFILALVDKMESASKDEKKLYLGYIISSYLFIKSYHLVESRLKALEFDEKNNALNLHEKKTA